MAILFTNLGASANPDINANNDASSYANSSWAPPTSGLLIAYVYNGATLSADSVAPTISGNSLTWTQIDTRLGGALRITLLAANLSGATAGVTTVSFGSSAQLGIRASLFHAENVDLTGGVAAAFVQTVKAGGTAQSPTLTLAAASHVDNRPISGFYVVTNETPTIRANWTLIDNLNENLPSRTLTTQWRSDAFETIASITFAGSSGYQGIAAELKASVSATHALTALSVETGSPTLGTPAIGQTHTLGAMSVEVGSPTLGVPSLGQTHALTAPNLETGAPTLGIPSIGRALGVETGAPVLDRPILTEGVLNPPVRGVETGAPVLDRPVLTDLGTTHALTATGIGTGAPGLGAPSLGQTHALVALSVEVSAPELGSPSLVFQVVLGSLNLETGAPTLGSPSLGQTHALIATGIETGVPELGDPAIGQTHVLGAVDIMTPAPILGRPTIASASAIHSLVPLSLQAGAPVLGRPSLLSLAVVVVVASQRRYIVPAENRILVIE